MRPLPLPQSTIDAYGATPVLISPPPEFEFSDGSKPEIIEGMRVGEVTYILCGIEEEDREALNRTHCFYIGFFSESIPIMTMRVADIIQDPTIIEEDVGFPMIVESPELFQEARDSWSWLDKVNGWLVCKEITEKTVYRQYFNDGSPADQLLVPGEYLVHNLRTGKAFGVSGSFLEAMFGEIHEREVQENNSTELQLDNSESQT